MLIVAGEVDVLHLERKGFADAEAQLGNETEKQPVTATMSGMAARMAATSPVRRPRGAGGSRWTRSSLRIGSAGT